MAVTKFSGDERESVIQRLEQLKHIKLKPISNVEHHSSHREYLVMAEPKLPHTTNVYTH